MGIKRIGEIMKKIYHLFRRYLFSCVLIFVGVLVLILFVDLMKTEEEQFQDYIEKTVFGIEKLSDVSIKNKMNVVRAFFVMEMNCNTPKLMHDIYNSSEQRKIEIREELYELHKSKFDNFKNLGIRQYQLHLKNAESFLRVDNPKNFGDDLSNVRKTVVDAIESKTLVTGLEEGLFSNGYRYVFPIIFEDELVGTIEYGYSLKSMLSPVFEVYSLSGLFLVNKEEVDKKTFTNITGNYITDIRFEHWYLDKSLSNENIEERIYLDKDEFENINRKVLVNIEHDLFGIDGFVYEIFDDNLVWAMPIEMKDYSGNVIGYLIYYKNDTVLNNIMKQNDSEVAVNLTIIIVFVLLLLLIWKLYCRTRVKAQHDGLTNLYNRHYFYNYLIGKVKVGTILMIDIDDFKLINDQYGHDCGDKVLTSLAIAFKENIRSSDNVLRWGGEEFLVLLKDTPLEEGYKKACHIRELVEKSLYNDRRLTISIGVSRLLDDFESSIKEADKALYFVKENGKNNVKIFERSMNP